MIPTEFEIQIGKVRSKTEEARRRIYYLLQDKAGRVMQI